MENKMLVSELEMPFIEAHLLVVDTETPFETRKEQINKLIEISKDFWICKSIIGYYIVKNSDTTNILRDKRWHSGLHVLQSLRDKHNPEVVAKRNNTLSAMDGEEHAHIRHIAAPAFSQSAAMDQKDFSYSYAKSLLENIINNGYTDFMEYFCNIYPITVLCNSVGLPKEDWEKFIKWGAVFASPVSKNFAIDINELKNAENEFYKYIIKLTNDRRVDPKDDFISKLVSPMYGEKGLTDPQVFLLIATMISGGIETLVSHLGMMFVYLCENPDIYKKIKDNRDEISDAVVEITRLTSSIRGTLRIASEDIEYRGVTFPKGTFVFTSIASSNQDQTVYGNADEFRFGRNHSKDLSFGAGMHYCMGAHLAKVEMTEAFRAVIDTFDRIELDSVQYRPSNSGIFGPEILNIKYTKAV
jgi:cytochrome P450